MLPVGATDLIVLNSSHEQVIEASPSGVRPARLGPSTALSLDLRSEGVGSRGLSRGSGASSSGSVPELSVADAISVAREAELQMQQDASRADDAKRRRLCSSGADDMSDCCVVQALSSEIPPGPMSIDRSRETQGDHEPTAVLLTSPPCSVSTGQTLESRTDSISSRLESALFADSPEDLASSQSPIPAMLTATITVPLVPKAAKGGRGLRSEGFKDVPGFEAQGLRVARCSKKLPKTQSWCFVPLIFSALGRVPERLGREGISTVEQISAAQPIWCELFSHWQEWRKELQQVIRNYDAARFEDRFLPKGAGNAKSWTTSLVYGEPRISGRLPHPHGGAQDAVLALLPFDIQNQIFASVAAIAS